MSDELPIPSGSTGLVDRAKNILMQPKPEWAKVAGETTEPMKVFTTYALPFLLIGPIATLIGTQLFTRSIYYAAYGPSIGLSITLAVVGFVLGVVLLFAIAFAASFLSKQFGGREDFPAAFRLVAYSLTAYWLAQVFGIVPMLGVLSIVGLYSFYLFYLGATPVMGVPEDKAVVYTVVTCVVVLVAYAVIAMLLSGIIIGMVLGFAGLATPGI